MNIYSHFSATGSKPKPFPFISDLAMEGYLKDGFMKKIILVSFLLSLGLAVFAQDNLVVPPGVSEDDLRTLIPMMKASQPSLLGTGITAAQTQSLIAMVESNQRAFSALLSTVGASVLMTCSRGQVAYGLVYDFLLESIRSGTLLEALGEMIGLGGDYFWDCCCSPSSDYAVLKGFVYRMLPFCENATPNGLVIRAISAHSALRSPCACDSFRLWEAACVRTWVISVH